MSDQYLGEIRMFAGNYAPEGWALCEGQLMSVSQNTALFELLGTTFGGNGITTFGLPDLRGRVPVGTGTGLGLTPRFLGEGGGEPAVTLGSSQLARHTHVPGAATDSNAASPLGNVWGGGGRTGGQDLYAPASAANLPMNPGAISPAGGGAPHNNLQPFLGINCIISLQGVIPPRS